MNIQYISFSISITIISWLVGIIFNSLLKKTQYYDRLSNLNLIKSMAVQQALQLHLFKWIVKNTLFRYFNPSLKLTNNVGKEELHALRDKMTFAELNHLVGFIFVSVFVLLKVVEGDAFFGFIMMMVNIFLNLYPSLLQQQNKRRIDKLVKRFS